MVIVFLKNSDYFYKKTKKNDCVNINIVIVFL